MQPKGYRPLLFVAYNKVRFANCKQFAFLIEDALKRKAHFVRTAAQGFAGGLSPPHPPCV